MDKMVAIYCLLVFSLRLYMVGVTHTDITTVLYKVRK